MNKNIVTSWIIISIIAAVGGSLWIRMDSENEIAFFVFFFGWMSSLLVIGYYSTPSNSLYGKILFGGVVVIVIGIAFKILHFTGGDMLIIVGLGILACTYVTMWLRNRPSSGNNFA